MKTDSVQSEHFEGRQLAAMAGLTGHLNIFFERYDMAECRAALWQLLSSAMACEEADHWDRQQRGDLVYFCGNIDRLLRELDEFRMSMK